MADDDIAFGQAVRRARTRQNMSQKQLAAALQAAQLTNIYPTTISRIESGERPVSLREAVGIAQALDTEIESLLADDAAGKAVANLKQQIARIESYKADMLLDAGRYLTNRTILGALVDKAKRSDWADSPSAAQLSAQLTVAEQLLAEAPEDYAAFTVSAEGLQEAQRGVTVNGKVRGAVMAPKEQAALLTYINGDADA